MSRDLLKETRKPQNKLQLISGHRASHSNLLALRRSLKMTSFVLVVLQAPPRSHQVPPLPRDLRREAQLQQAQRKGRAAM